MARIIGKQFSGKCPEKLLPYLEGVNGDLNQEKNPPYHCKLFNILLRRLRAWRLQLNFDCQFIECTNIYDRNC